MATVFDSENCAPNMSNQRQTDEDDENAAASGATLNCRDCVRQETSLLFQPSSTAGRRGSSRRGKKRKNLCSQKTWTVQFVCLSLLVLQKRKETGVTDFIPRKASSRLSLVPNNALCLYTSCWSQTCSMVFTI